MVVISQDNAGDLDYGPTIILEHHPESGPKFYTLYGHLSRDCLKLVKIGQKIKAGEAFAATGNCDENGVWPTHLHLQMVLDLLDFEGNVPGVASPSQFDLWQSLSPDPSLLAGFVRETSVDGLDKTELLNQRKKVFGPSLSLSYELSLIHISEPTD